MKHGNNACDLMGTSPVDEEYLPMCERSGRPTAAQVKQRPVNEMTLKEILEELGPDAHNIRNQEAADTLDYWCTDADFNSNTLIVALVAQLIGMVTVRRKNHD